jgi:hypothetical protein
MNENKSEKHLLGELLAVLNGGVGGRPEHRRGFVLT